MTDETNQTQTTDTIAQTAAAPAPAPKDPEEAVKAIFAFVDDFSVKLIANLKDGLSFSDLRILVDPTLHLEARKAFDTLSEFKDEIEHLDLKGAEDMLDLSEKLVEDVIAAIKAK